VFKSFILIIHIFMADGSYGYERIPIEAPVCETVDGVRKEDSTCGIRYCLQKGKERAAVLWGRDPGSNYGVQCNASDGTEEASVGTSAGGGHPALGFEPTK
jgi:hypothetical protein